MLWPGRSSPGRSVKRSSRAFRRLFRCQTLQLVQSFMRDAILPSGVIRRGVVLKHTVPVQMKIILVPKIVYLSVRAFETRKWERTLLVKRSSARNCKVAKRSYTQDFFANHFVGAFRGHLTLNGLRVTKLSANMKERCSRWGWRDGRKLRRDVGDWSSKRRSYEAWKNVWENNTKKLSKT